MADGTEPLPHVALAGGYGTRYPHRGHYYLNAGIGLLSFICACAVLHGLLPFPEIPEVTTKLQYFAGHKDEFDTVFLGSSRIYHHVIPDVFDRVATEHGASVHSFNLGVSGMHSPESFYLLEQILRMKPARLKWVFLEFEELYPNFSKERATTRRFQYWHNWKLTALALGKTLTPDGHNSWAKTLWRGVRADTARVHLSVFFKNFANVGRARDVRDWFATRASRTSSSTWSNLKHDRGYIASFRPMTPEEAAQYREKFRNGIVEDDDNPPSGEAMGEEQIVQYQKQLEQSLPDARPYTIDPWTDVSYRIYAKKIRASGAQAICVVTAVKNLKQLRFRDMAAPAPVLAFNDLNKYAALYDPRVRVDPAHMTPEGANLFTVLLAERFVKEVALAK